MEEFEKPSATHGHSDQKSKRIVYPVRPSNSSNSSNSTHITHKETLERIRRDLKKQREELTKNVMSVHPSKLSTLSRPLKQATEDKDDYDNDDDSEIEMNTPASNVDNKDEERKKLQRALKKEQEVEKAFRPDLISPKEAVTTTSTTVNKHHTNGWKQSDGRRAEQLDIYDYPLPKHIRSRLEPVKENHFRFRNKSDEKALLDSLTSSSQTANYQSTGKKDVTLTSTDGRLIGNIHFLHMDRPDVHHPEKYYMKFFLFNFVDSDTLHDTKQRILEFTRTFGSHGSHGSHGSEKAYTLSPKRRMTHRRGKKGKKVTRDTRDTRRRYTSKTSRRNLK